jgi:hypothetical protein
MRTAWDDFVSVFSVRKLDGVLTEILHVNANLHGTVFHQFDLLHWNFHILSVFSNKDFIVKVIEVL